MKAKGTIANHRGRYRARCRIDGRSTHLGVFDSPELAQAAIDAALAGCPPKEKPTRATLDQLATRLRVKRGTIGRWASEGMAGLTRDPGTGLVVDVDLEAAAAWALARYPKTVAADRTSVVYFRERLFWAARDVLLDTIERRTVYVAVGPWNDARGRTQAEVVQALRAAAETCA